jgi:hypothetical protein
MKPPQLPPAIQPKPLSREELDEMRQRGCTPRQVALAELRGEGHSHADADRIIVRRAHGHLCSALAHLFHAASLFAEDQPDVCGLLRRHAAKLGEIVPSYGEFDAATRKPRTSQ